MGKAIVNQIAYRNIVNKKGKSICIAVAIFLTAFLSMVAVCSYSYIEESVQRLMESERTWGGDAGVYIYSEDTSEAISKDHAVDQSCKGYHLGVIEDDQGYIQTEVVYYSDLIATWMNCYPNKGRMPQGRNEVVVSDEFLNKYGETISGNDRIKIEYTINGYSKKDEFLVVGVYEKTRGVKDMVLVSKGYYSAVSEKAISAGADQQDFPILIEMTFKNKADIETNLYALMERVGIDPDAGEFIVNSDIDVETLGHLKIAWAVIMFFVFLLGYFFVSNVYSVSLNEEEKFYRRLQLVGTGRRDLRRIIYKQINLLYIPGAVLGVLAGYFFSDNILPKVLSSFFSFDVSSLENTKLIILPFLITYIAVLSGRGKVFKMIRSMTKLNGKASIKPYKRGAESKLKNLLLIMVMRRLCRSKKFVVITVITLFASILGGNLVLSYVNGFDVKEYIASSLYNDFTIHSSLFSESYNDTDRVFEGDMLDELNEADGIVEKEGATVFSTNIKLHDEIQKKYEQSGVLSSNEEGNMYTNVYGLGENFLGQMKVLSGEIDKEKFLTGNYAIINSLGLEENGKSCWDIGDFIEISGTNGETRTYTVMAIAELPYELTYQSKWEGSSDVFLDIGEWKELTGRNDYYIYTYNIEDSEKEDFEKKCKNVVTENSNLTYESAKTIYEENNSYFKELKLMTVLLLVFVLVSTIINFFNVVFNEMIGLKREVANMQSMGIPVNKIRGMFVIEGFAFLMTGIVLGAALSPIICRLFIENIINEIYVSYSYSIIVVLMYLLLGLLAVSMTAIFFKKCVVTKRTISERVREQ
ncbi:MAG: FtsX-like permease family protein [Lachnospiraceae bacterium]|nr:FtsX-like permease family protein [Lachnospiraceae bacterium]